MIHEEALVTPTPVRIGNKRTKHIHSESFSKLGKLIIPHNIEFTPKSLLSPRKLAENEMKYMVAACHKPMSTRPKQVIHIKKCPNLIVPALDVTSICEDPTVYFLDNRHHGRTDKKRRQ